MPQRDWECPKCGANVFASKDACFKCGAEKSSGAGRGGKCSLAGGESSERPSAEVARSSRMDVEPSSSATDKLFVEVSAAATSKELPVLGRFFQEALTTLCLRSNENQKCLQTNRRWRQAEG